MYKINIKHHERYFNTIYAQFINIRNFRFKRKLYNHSHLRQFQGAILPSISKRDTPYVKPLLAVSYYSCQHKGRDRSPKYVPKPVKDSKEKALSNTRLTNSLQKCESVAQQFEVFHSAVNLPDADISHRHSICLDLQKYLQPYFPSASIHLVGSSINGLGLKGCDIDLSLQISNMNTEKLLAENMLVHEENFFSVERISSLPPKNQLLTIRKIFQNLKFEEPLTVIPGRCPILNFYFNNLPCDLAINNSSALHGTNLMLLCGKLDERVAPIMQIIIYWAKYSKLIGGVGKFKTYAVFLLVIYFLQTRNPPILPTVETIFQKSDFLQNLENWSYDVEKFLDNFQLSKNVQTVEELLREFFFFYENFDFSYIICPLHGTVIDRKTFASKFDLENSFELNTICIQDPLSCAWNVASEVNWRNFKSFFKALISVCAIYQDQSCWIPGPGNWGLASLIDSKFSYDAFKDIKELSISIPLVAVTDNFDSRDLLLKASEKVKCILNYCLLFDCHLVNSNINFSSLELPRNVRSVIENYFLNNSIYENQTENLELDMDSFKNSEFIVHYLCAVKNTWLGRNVFNSVYSNTEDALHNEHTLSKKIIQEKGSSEKELLYFLCECHGEHLENNFCLHVKLKPLSSDRFNPKLAIFLKEYILKTWDNLQFGSLNKKQELILR